MKAIFFIVLTMLSYFSGSAVAEQKQRELKVAEEAILWGKISASTKKGRTACSRSTFACRDSDSELGLAYIAMGNDSSSLILLSNIIKYKMDAGLSESYTCYLLDKGMAISSFLKKINPRQLEDNCVKQVFLIKKNNAPRFSDLNVEYICNDKDDIKMRVESIVSAIDNSIKCIDE